MARRRDRVTRRWERYDRRDSEATGRNVVVPVARDEGVRRVRGRRGVRARARLARIRATQFSQPNGGTVTNS